MNRLFAAAWVIMGPALPIIAGTFLLYGLLGQHLELSRVGLLLRCRFRCLEPFLELGKPGQVAVARVATSGGRVVYSGVAQIDGVPGRAAPVPITFQDTAGSSCGALLPTGSPSDVIDGVECTLIDNGISQAGLETLESGEAMPDILGINHYLTSERFLDHRVSRYPDVQPGSNSIHEYADLEAVRVSRLRNEVGPAHRLREAWERYGIPLVYSEVHHGCTREERESVAEQGSVASGLERALPEHRPAGVVEPHGELAGGGKVELAEELVGQQRRDIEATHLRLPLREDHLRPEGVVQLVVLAPEGRGGERSRDELPERVEVVVRRPLG